MLSVVISGVSPPSSPSYINLMTGLIVFDVRLAAGSELSSELSRVVPDAVFHLSPIPVAFPAPVPLAVETAITKFFSPL